MARSGWRRGENGREKAPAESGGQGRNSYYRSTNCEIAEGALDAGDCIPSRHASTCGRAPRELARVRERLPIVELLRALAFDQHVAVVEGVEINFDYVSTGVIDPHVAERMGHD